MPDLPNSPSDAEPPVLVFDHVGVAAEESSASTGLDGVSFSLDPGAAFRIFLGDGPGSGRMLADLACGIREPDRGEVRFLGLGWDDRLPAEAAARRGRIGRVFSGTAWLSNLDMDENLLLAARHHASATESELMDRAGRLARRFGLERIPEGRPAWVRAGELQVAQWIRALIHQPRLLVLEEPVTSAVRPLAAALSNAVVEARNAGTAVLWLTTRPEPDANEGGAAVEQFTLEDGRLRGPARGSGRQQEKEP